MRSGRVVGRSAPSRGRTGAAARPGSSRTSRDQVVQESFHTIPSSGCSGKTPSSFRFSAFLVRLVVSWLVGWALLLLCEQSCDQDETFSVKGHLRYQIEVNDICSAHVPRRLELGMLEGAST